MDGLEALLDGPRARSAFVLRCLLDPPWSVRLEDESPLTVTAVVRGSAWVVPRSGSPFPVEAGDVVVTTGPDHWTLTHDLATAPQVRILPGQRCVALDGHTLEEEMHQGLRTWGNSSVGETQLLVGAYGMEGEVSRRLLRALPPFVTLTEKELDSPLVEMLSREATRDAAGQAAVLDRLLDLLLIVVLRTWFDGAAAHPPGWYVAQTDAVVGPALRLMHHHPAHPWTVAELASHAQVSRAAFARRFTEAVGEPPMAFLAGWRLALAADLLREPDATVAAVAQRVGYSTPFALSAAFKRTYGMSPRDHRRSA